MKIRKLVFAMGCALTLALASGPPVAACPNCKEAVANQSPEEAARLKNGYFYSILLMVSMPFALAGTGIFLVTRAAKRGWLPEI
jgi:hypothetical protein